VSAWKNNRLRVLRAERKVSQEDVAARLAISQPLYSRIERGTREPSKEELVKLARVFDVSVNELEEAS
jgi:putative transcriptional regulator